MNQFQPHQLVPTLPSQPKPTKPPSKWRFWVPLIVQLSLIVAVPAQAVYTHIFGKTVILQTLPVDPYDLLRGYSQILRYDISNLDNLDELSGWDQVAELDSERRGRYLPPGTRLYVILEAPPASDDSVPPQPWKAIAISPDLPAELPENQIALQGAADNRWVDYGLESYYMPEAQRSKINDEILQLQRGGEQAFVVEAKVDRRGKSVPVSLWVGDRHYRF